MDITKILRDNNLEIKILGTQEEPLFKASDIGIILKITNIRTSIQNFDDSEKCRIDYKDIMQRFQKTTFLTIKGLKKLICNSRKPEAINLAKLLNIDINDIFHIPLETSLINFLQIVYKDEKLINQYNVNPYRIDLYFPEYKIAIECDEYFHIFQKEDDLKREIYIKEKLDCIFIRFKQDKKNTDLPNVIYQINKIIYKIF